MSDKPEIHPGDVVAILEHESAPELYPELKFTEPASEGWVVTGISPFLRSGYISANDCFTLEKLPDPDEGWQPNRMRFIRRSRLQVQKRGSGAFTRGVDLPFNQSELRKQRFDLFRAKVAIAIVQRGKHEGFINPATWHVALVLGNDAAFVRDYLPGLRRRDGTINPNRLQKHWNDGWSRGRYPRPEPWMYASPIDVPSEFARWRIQELDLLRVDWNEVAEHFASEGAKLRAKARA